MIWEERFRDSDNSFFRKKIQRLIACVLILISVQANLGSIDEPGSEPGAGDDRRRVQVDLGVHRRAGRRRGGRSLGLQHHPLHQQAPPGDHQERLLPQEHEPDELLLHLTSS